MPPLYCLEQLILSRGQTYKQENLARITTTHAKKQKAVDERAFAQKQKRPQSRNNRAIVQQFDEPNRGAN